MDQNYVAVLILTLMVDVFIFISPLEATKVTDIFHLSLLRYIIVKVRYNKYYFMMYSYAIIHHRMLFSYTFVFR